MRSSFTADDCAVNTTALVRLSRTALASGSEFTELLQGVVDEAEASRAATAKVERDVERQKTLVSVTEKSANNAFNDVASLRDVLQLPVRVRQSYYIARRRLRVR